VTRSFVLHSRRMRGKKGALLSVIQRDVVVGGRGEGHVVVDVVLAHVPLQVGLLAEAVLAEGTLQRPSEECPRCKLL